MTNKMEQLIEYVINDEQDKAHALFHDIVVEKSREIYENLMNEEDDVERDDKAEKAGRKVAKDIEYDEKHDRYDESVGGDASDSLIDEVEVEEEGMSEDEESDEEFDDEAEEEGEDLTKDIEHDHDEGDIENRVVDLEDKLDELMAEFEAMMGDEDSDDEEFDMVAKDDEVGGDAYADDDTEEFIDVDSEEELAENVSLKAAPKPVTSEPAGTGSRSPNANNSGSRGAMAVPVKMVGDTAKGRPNPTAGNLPDAGNFKNVPGKDGSKLDAAPKPVTTQAAGVNNKTPFPKV